MREPKQPRLGDRAIIEDPDFQAAFRHLLFVCAPLIQRQWKESRHPDELLEYDSPRTGNCDQELALGGRMFDRFFTEEVAVRVAGQGGAKSFGQDEAWQAGLSHLRGCMTFGWALSRGQGSPRAYGYYASRFWKHLRSLDGRSMEALLTPQERSEYRELVAVMADGSGLQLADEPEDADIPVSLPDELLAASSGDTDRQQAAAVIFETMLDREMTRLRLREESAGRRAGASQLRHLHGWSVLAFRFGAGLGTSRTLSEVLRCLMSFYRSMREHSGAGVEAAEPSGADGRDEAGGDEPSRSFETMPAGESRQRSAHGPAFEAISLGRPAWAATAAHTGIFLHPEQDRGSIAGHHGRPRRGARLDTAEVKSLE